MNLQKINKNVKFIADLKFALFILFLIALVSSIGSIIEQEETIQFYQTNYSIENPIYGYDPITEKEVDFSDENAIVVMAVDNLPCELPKDASEGFGEMFLVNVIPAFFDGDKNGILSRAKITEKGMLTERFSYLQDYVDGRE